MTIQYKIAEKNIRHVKQNRILKRSYKKLINWGPYLQPHNRRSKLCTTTQLVYFMTLISREKICWWLINHFYVIRHENYRIRRNNAKLWPLQRSRSSKVTDFGTNRKPICDFLIVINTNLPRTLHRFQVMADCQIFASDRRVLHFNALARGDPLRISPQMIYRWKLHILGYISLAECIGLSSTTFT